MQHVGSNCLSFFERYLKPRPLIEARLNGLDKTPTSSWNQQSLADEPSWERAKKRKKNILASQYFFPACKKGCGKFDPGPGSRQEFGGAESELVPANTNWAIDGFGAER